jgi:drug/metabolite transporter (DMT)-like permease
MTDNLRGICLMVLAMAGFAVADSCIKLASQAMPMGQVLVSFGAGGTLVFVLIARAKGLRLWTAEALQRPVLLRNAGEIIGTCGVVMALSLLPLSLTSAILQVNPLAVTFAVAVVLREPVGWRRWTAIMVGFAGVMVIIRPGAAAFDPAILWAVLGVIGLTLRDVATRAVPRGTENLKLATWGFASLMPLGMAMLAITGGTVEPDLRAQSLLIGAVLSGTTAYWAITAAMRVGDVGVVTPFRYTRLIFAMGIGIVVFAEHPDGWTYAGSALVVASGIYTLWREGRRA